MAILIPDMKMPKNCAECECEYDGWYCSITRQNFGEDIYTSRMPDCPLIEVNADAEVISLMGLMATELSREEAEYAQLRAEAKRKAEIIDDCCRNPNDDIMAFVKALSDASGVGLQNEDGTYKSPLDFTQEISDWLYRKDKKYGEDI